MLVLGVSDVPSPSAAVVADGVVRAVAGAHDVGDAFEGDDPFPWPVIDVALATAGARRSDVSTLAVAGKFTAPWAMRRSRRLGAFSSRVPVRQVQAAWQMALRSTGLGAFAADLTAERMEARVRGAGFTQARVVMVDSHRALAEAGYRAQPHDDVLVVTFQSLGDGNALTVHRGRGGMLDRLSEQAGGLGLHAHLARVASALDLPLAGGNGLDGLAGYGRVDPELVADLAKDLRASGGQLGTSTTSLIDDVLLSRLRAVSREDAAASVISNLADTLASIVRRQARQHGVRRVVLLGALAELPRVVLQVAERADVDAIFVPPRAGREALAVGAACQQGGIGPVDTTWRTGAEPDHRAVERALRAMAVRGLDDVDPVDCLAQGLPLVRWTGRSGLGALGLGERAILVRGDRYAAIDAVRAALGAPAWLSPIAVVGDGSLNVAPQGACLRVATTAVRPPQAWSDAFPALVGPDGATRPLRVDARDAPELAALVSACAQAGIGALAALPLLRPDGHTAATVPQAVATYQKLAGAALQLGDRTVRTRPRS